MVKAPTKKMMDRLLSVYTAWSREDQDNTIDTTPVTVSSNEEIQNIETVVMLVMEAVTTNTPICNITNHSGLNEFIKHQVNCIIKK